MASPQGQRREGSRRKERDASRQADTVDASYKRGGADKDAALYVMFKEQGLKSKKMFNPSFGLL